MSDFYPKSIKKSWRVGIAYSPNTSEILLLQHKINSIAGIFQKADRRGIDALTVCYMFQSTFVLPSSLIMILCIMIIATAFFRS